MTPEVILKETEESWAVGTNNGTDVGSAGAEGLLPSICRREADHCPENHGVGDRDAQDVKASNQEGNHQTVDRIGLDISTR